jgi:hypothetical protein
MSEKIIALSKGDIKEVKCVYASGYNSHYYTIVYDNSNGRYIGEIEDTSWEKCNFKRKLYELIETNG